MKILDIIKTNIHCELLVNGYMINSKIQSGKHDPYSMKSSQLDIMGKNVGIIPIWAYVGATTIWVNIVALKYLAWVSVLDG